MSAALEIESLEVRYGGIPAVRGLNLKLDERFPR